MRANVNNDRLLFGLVVLVAGVLFTLDNLGVVDAWDYLQWWPMLLIVSGVWRIVHTRNAAGVIGGLIVAFIGVLLLDKFAHVLPGHVWNYWPLVLVLFGASMVVRAWQGPGGTATVDPGARFNAFALMSGVERKYNSPAFRGGDATAIMGGCEIDLRQAQIVDGPAVVDVFAFWGGVDLFVPSDWVVRNEAIVIMGGISDSRKSVGSEGGGTASAGGALARDAAASGVDPNRVLVLRGGALMGGIELKN